MSRFLDVPLINLTVVAVLSLVVAILTFRLGGSLAEISDQEGNFLGFTFKAGGALAGFVIVFLLSSKELQKMHSTSAKSSFSIKIPAVDSQPTGFSQATHYSCKCMLFDTESGTRREINAEYTWEAGFLTVFAAGVRGNDLVRIRVEDGFTAWESEDFDPLTRAATMKPIRLNAQ